MMSEIPFVFFLCLYKVFVLFFHIHVNDTTMNIYSGMSLIYHIYVNCSISTMNLYDLVCLFVDI